MRDRHFAFFLDLTRRAEPQLVKGNSFAGSAASRRSTTIYVPGWSGVWRTSLVGQRAWRWRDVCIGSG